MKNIPTTNDRIVVLEWRALGLELEVRSASAPELPVLPARLTRAQARELGLRLIEASE